MAASYSPSVAPTIARTAVICQDFPRLHCLVCQYDFCYDGDMNDDKLTIALAEDKVLQCEERNYAVNTGFLDTHQQSVLRQAFARRAFGCKVLFTGGYEDAERRILLCLPEYMEEEDAGALTVVRASIARPGGRKLTHRDYLGSLMGAGIKREIIGDILVREDGADIIALAEMAPYLMTEYHKAGRTELSLEEHALEELILPQQQAKQVRDTVASPRLDSIVASAFGLSRAKAAAAVTSGMVLLNHVETLKPDAAVEEGDLINLRKNGRVRITGIGGHSRKGRVYVEMEIYR